MNGLGRLLALDVGKSHVGIAYSDECACVAFPGCRIKRDDHDFWQQLDNTCKNLGAKKIVVGWPLTLKGKLGKQVDETSGFCSQLQERLNLPVVTWDERLTSKEARDLTKGLRGRHKPDEDSLAAYIILKSYIASLTSKTELSN